MSNNCHERYILDAYAVLCYLEYGETKAQEVSPIFQ